MTGAPRPLRARVSAFGRLASAAVSFLCAAGVDAAPQVRGGVVLQVTGKRAYLSAGARDGLEAGSQLKTAPQRACTVEKLADRFATCVGNVRAGDSFPLPPRQPPAALKKPAGPLAAAEVQRRRAALEAVQPPLIEFAPSPMAAGEQAVRGRSRVALSHATWANTAAGPYQQECADVRLHAPIAGPVRIDADFTALRWSARPGTARFRPDDPWQLYVREAALTASSVGGARATLGRLRPLAPGATAVDGLSAALGLGGGSELSVYAGALPDPSTTAPGTDRITAGAAWRVQHAGETGDLVRWARHEGRASVVSLPGGDKRYEVEAGGLAAFGRAVDLSGDVRLAAGAFAPTAAIDALRIELVARLGEAVRLTGAIRHQALPFPVDALTSSVRTADSAAAFSGGPSRHADASASWDVIGPLQLSATGGFANEAGSGLYRAFGGPEVSLGGLFGGLASLGAGYLEERGWLEGRSAWAQASFAPRAPFHALLRGSWSRDRRGNVPGSVDEVGLFASAGARVWKWLELRGSLLGRASLTGEGAGLSATASAAGEF